VIRVDIQPKIPYLSIQILITDKTSCQMLFYWQFYETMCLGSPGCLLL